MYTGVNMLSVSIPGTRLRLKISLIISTTYGTTSSVQYVKCSVINAKESAALLFFFSDFSAWSVVGVIGSDDRRQISSMCIRRNRDSSPTRQFPDRFLEN